MRIIAHKVGNKILSEELNFYPELYLDIQKTELLQNYFLSAFKTEETYHFYSDTYLTFNRVFSAVTAIFRDPENFKEASEEIADRLYEAAENPRVQGGELFVIYFPKQDDNDVDKVGIFKTEKRETFLKIHPNSPFDPMVIDEDKGISLARIDKAALIYNTEKDNGYILQVVDNNKNGDLYYWFEDFLKVKQRTDEYFHTSQTMSVFKDYVTKQLPVEFEVSKADQADFLNRSLAFFKEKEEFKFDDFVSEVIEDEKLIDSFSDFKSDYEQDMQISISEDFAINTQAVKKSQRHFKSVIQLDKNFHIYVHGDRKLLEQGSDDKGKFYKVYFENEA